MNSSFPNRWSFSYLKFTKYVTNIIDEPTIIDEENLFMPYANNKGADQPAHPRSLISAFVVRCLDSIIHTLAKSKTLASLCSWAGRFESYQGWTWFDFFRVLRVRQNSRVNQVNRNILEYSGEFRCKSSDWHWWVDAQNDDQQHC